VLLIDTKMMTLDDLELL